MKIKSVRGTHDILPDTVAVWHKIESTTRELFKLYGYSELRTPIFEDTELFSRSIGMGTDIVQKEMYTFNQNKNKTVSLRPEGTAPVVRAYIEHALHRQTTVNKFYYIGPMFRRERPQKGRYRQFHQIGVEVLGSDAPALEGEVIEMLHRLMGQLGLHQFELLINSVGCTTCRPHYINILCRDIDKTKKSFCTDCQHRFQNNPLRILDCKIRSCQPFIENLPSILDHLCSNCQDHLSQLRLYLELLKVPHRLSSRLVRGLDYYVRTTFEITSKYLGPTQNAIVGGGRYDGLSEILGGPRIQGFGFALGMERLIWLLSEKEDSFSLNQSSPPDLFLVYLDKSSLELSLKLAQELRGQGVFVYIDFQKKSVKAQMRLANRMNARFTCVIGEDETKSGYFQIKRMKDGQKVALTRETLADFFNPSLSPI